MAVCENKAPCCGNRIGDDSLNKGKILFLVLHDEHTAR